MILEKKNKVRYLTVGKSVSLTTYSIQNKSTNENVGAAIRFSNRCLSKVTNTFYPNCQVDIGGQKQTRRMLPIREKATTTGTRTLHRLDCGV